MSQHQQERPQEEPIKYDDLFSIQADTANKAVAPPREAAMIQASAVQSAAAKNMNDAAEEVGVRVKETDMHGRRMITESIAGQIVGQNSQRVAPTNSLGSSGAYQQGGSGNVSGGITIGEALEATALTAGQKAVEWSDAAAIQAAEVRATGRTTISPGGVAAAAQSAATLNARATRDEDKTKLADILADATSKLPADRPATRKDAEGVTGAEMRNDPYLTTHPAGVAASIAAAARLNQQNNFK
ncbi:late embryogenesis abundant protein 47-like [Ricinus communis]|uniref:Late embryogenesis abundant protein D-34, putative n=1 Tax=Ricinus communis TaxID=3988 RepID=B9REU2_RICCO|nr:late embryogenesis abundant protein 47 [Ricinus communis]XP_048226105.1 late embryogenesis abundant protein 47-like [Ricinus communis]EEF49713.1 Late embryogenesis abundant protein D-34, putative [Ricinus communis]|eukprot:XP_002512261.1 late embryogenesis abundant protein 47 [Ricinus communis]